MNARVVDATRAGSACARFFVASATRDGMWYRVDLTPGESLTCSCPRGRAISRGDILQSKGCRHLIAVVERMEARVS